MHRKMLLGVCAAATMFAAACSSSTPAATSTSTTSAVAAATSAAPVSSVAAVTSDAPTSSVAPLSSDTAAASSAPAATTSASEATPSSPSAPASLGSVAVTETVGNTSGALDAASTKWFDTLCTGIKPITALSSGGASGGSTDATAAAGNELAQLKTAGSSLTATVGKLKALPAPGFSGGADFATKAEAALGELGTALTKAAAGDTSAASSLNSSAVKDLQAIKPTPQLEKQVQQIPSCKAVNFGGSS